MRKRNLLNLLVFLVLITIVFWIVQIVNGHVPFIDQWTRELVEGFVDSSLYTIAFLITNLGSRQFLIPFVIVAAIVLGGLYRHWLPPVMFVGGTLFSYLLNGIVKDIIQRERPTVLIEANAVGNSFPSGHAMISMVCYGLLAYFLSRKMKSRKISLIIQIFFSFIIFIIGISRFIINVHYLTDVLAGFVIGFIFLICFIYLYERLQKK